MPLLTVHIHLSKTVTGLDAATITTLANWIQTNIKDKLPAETTLSISYEINP